MKITRQLTLSQYVNLMYRLTYRKPRVFFTTIVGLFLLSTPFLYYSGLGGYQTPPTLNILLGLSVLVVIPLSVYIQARRNFTSHKRLQETITYEFTPEALVMTGESFHSTAEWRNTHKILELDGWFIIYESARTAFFISKAGLDASQVVWIREFLKGLPGIQKRMKRG